MAEEVRVNSLDLQEGKVTAKALVAALAEGNVGPLLGDVAVVVDDVLALAAGGQEAVGVELGGGSEDIGEKVSDSRGGDDDVALGNSVAVEVLVLLHRAHHNNNRGEKTERLLDAEVEQGHLLHSLVGQLVAVLEVGAKDCLLLLEETREDSALVGSNEHAEPGRGDVRGVLAGEEAGNEEADNLVDGQLTAVLVTAVDKLLEEVLGGVKALLLAAAAAVDDGLEETNHLLAGLVTLLVLGVGGVGEDHRQASHAVVEVLVLVGDLRVEGLADLVAHEAAGSGVDDEGRELLVEVHGASSLEVLEVEVALHEDLVDVALHVLAVERVAEEGELALHEGQGRVVDDVAAKDRDSEVVHLTGSEDLVGGVVKELVAVRANQEGDALGADLDAEDGAVLVVASADEVDGAVLLHVELAREHGDKIVEARGELLGGVVKRQSIQGHGDDDEDKSNDVVLCWA